MVEVICAVIAAAATVICAYLTKHVSAQSTRAEKRQALRREESLLSMEMMDATMQLCIVTANALTGGHNNGNVERAREASKAASEKYRQFMRETTAYEVGK